MKKKISYLIIIIIAAIFIYICTDLINYGSSYGEASNIVVENSVEKTGAINTVTATVFNFRGYDTLGESIVLFTAVSGVAVVLRNVKKKKEEEA